MFLPCKTLCQHSLTRSVRTQLGSAREYLECKPAHGAYDCQAGLTRSHIAAWQRIAKSGEPAAWVFEYEQPLTPTQRLCISPCALLSFWWQSCSVMHDLACAMSAPRSHGCTHHVMSLCDVDAGTMLSFMTVSSASFQSTGSKCPRPSNSSSSGMSTGALCGITQPCTSVPVQAPGLSTPPLQVCGMCRLEAKAWLHYLAPSAREFLASREVLQVSQIAETL